MTPFWRNLSFAAVVYDTENVRLSEAPALPLCPSCDALLQTVRWHRVRKGPPVTYLVAFTCGNCGALLDCLSAGAATAGVFVAAS